MKTAVFASALVIVCSGASLNCAADWPQWRGPARNGFVEPGQALADSWPDDGPRLLWKSQELPTANDSGFASPVVSDGRVYQYISWGHDEPLPTRTLTDKQFTRLGEYAADLPADLLAKIEQARRSEARKALGGKEAKEWAAKWVEKELNEAQREQYGKVADDRLRRGDRAFDYDALAKAFEIVDKQMQPDAFDKWLADSGLTEEQQREIRKLVPTSIRRANDVVLCISLADGSTLWKQTLPGAARHWGASSTPCVADGRVIVGGTRGVAYCLNAKDGAVIWTREVRNGEVNSSPVATGQRVLIQAGPLVALNLETGEELWRQQAVGHRNTSPAIWSSGGKTLAICNSGNKLIAVDVATGDVAWSVEGAGGDASPAIDGDTAVVLTNRKNEDGLAVFRLRLDGAERVAAADASARGSSAVVRGSHIYASAEGRVICVTAASGEKQWEGRAGKDSFSSPVLAGGKLIAAGGGRLVLIDASDKSFKELAKARVDVLRCTSPALVDGKLILRGKDALYCFDLAQPVAKTDE